MKRFQSRIEALQRLREQTEKLARMQAAVRQKEKADADRQLTESEQQLQNVLNLGMQVVDSGNTAMIQSMVNATARAEAAIRIAETLQLKTNENLAAAQQAVSRAKMQVQITDKYRERELKAFRHAVRIDEENTRDESNGRRFAARRPLRSQTLPTHEAEAD
ncbi:MAG: hypothetical protein Fues2KO_05100 [Fuerstiella sp.]